jgi:hypothetical protein
MSIENFPVKAVIVCKWWVKPCVLAIYCSGLGFFTPGQLLIDHLVEAGATIKIKS